MKRFWSWLGRIVENENHPFTKALANSLSLFVAILMLGAFMVGMSMWAADDYGTKEKVANMANLAGLTAAGVLGRYLKG